MPKKLTDEQKQEAFNAWKETDEYNKIMEFAMDARQSVFGLEMSTKDIVENWKKYLDGIYELGTLLKVPGRKVKSRSHC